MAQSISISFRKDQGAKLKVLTTMTNKSASQIIREALDDYIQKMCVSRRRDYSHLVDRQKVD